MAKANDGRNVVSVRFERRTNVSPDMFVVRHSLLTKTIFFGLKKVHLPRGRFVWKNDPYEKFLYRIRGVSRSSRRERQAYAVVRRLTVKFDTEKTRYTNNTLERIILYDFTTRWKRVAYSRRVLTKVSTRTECFVPLPYWSETVRPKPRVKYVANRSNSTGQRRYRQV